MNDQEKQLVIFQEALPESVPESRKTALVKTAKNRGIEAAKSRALLFDVYRPMTDAVVAQYVRRGETKSPGGKCIALNKQIKTAIGSDVKNADVKQIGLAIFMRETFTEIVNGSEGGEDESFARKAVVNAVIEMRTKVKGKAA